MYKCKHWQPRITVAAIIRNDQNQFLCVEEYNSQKKAVIGQPSGHVERNESITNACVRETLEETGYHIQPLGFIGVQQWHKPNTDMTFFRFLLHAKIVNHCPEQTLDEGIIRALWMTKEELIQNKPRLRTPLVLKAIDDFLERDTAPLDMIQCFL